MTAKEYLQKQLLDPFVELCSPQTRIALCAYAMRIKDEIDGYSRNELKKLIKDCGYGDDFAEQCCVFTSNTTEAYEYYSCIPQLDD